MLLVDVDVVGTVLVEEVVLLVEVVGAVLLVDVVVVDVVLVVVVGACSSISSSGRSTWFRSSREAYVAPAVVSFLIAKV